MKRYYPYIYGAIAGALTFVAMLYICLHSFAMTTAQSVIWGVDLKFNDSAVDRTKSMP